MMLYIDWRMAIRRYNTLQVASTYMDQEIAISSVERLKPDSRR